MRVDAEFPANPAGLAAIRVQAETIARGCALGDAQVSDLKIAVSEAATSLAKHDDAGAGEPIRLGAGSSDGELTVAVSRRSEPTEPESEEEDFGLAIIASLAEESDVRIADGRRTITMVFACG